MDKRKVWKKKHSKRSRRMGWKSKRNKEVKIYITIFLVCAIIAGVIALITGKGPSLLQKTVDRQIARKAEEVVEEHLKDIENIDREEYK